MFQVNNFRSFSVFFCPIMRYLAGRGQTIERACESRLGNITVERRYLNKLSAGEPVTLVKIF